jgi:GPH family glycoside/pentoside/hexuronide:cation symporter
MSDSPPSQQLSHRSQLSYGAGDFGPSMAGNLLVVFCFFFLTNVAGLSASLTGLVLLLSNIWSALSMLVVGVLSDRTQHPWGRRRIWLACSAPILALSFFLHWLVPPTGELTRFLYYSLVAILFQTAGTAFLVPYGALLTDLTDISHEQTRLTSYRFSFSLGGGIGALFLAKALTDWFEQPQQQFLALGLAGSAFIIFSIFSCCLGTQERLSSPPKANESSSSTWKSLLGNRPLLLLVGIFSLSWLAVQLIPAVLPYFVLNCMELDASAVTTTIAVMQGTALLALFIWEPISRQVGKKTVYCVGTTLWILAQIGLAQLNPGQEHFMYGMGMLAGLGMATAYLVPPSMLPEVIDWDELKTGQRREGLFYSLMMCLQKLVLAFGLFLVGQLLSYSGFVQSLPGEALPLQPTEALQAIRFAIGWLPILALLGSLGLIVWYPIDAKIHREMVAQLQSGHIAFGEVPEEVPVPIQAEVPHAVEIPDFADAIQSEPTFAA